MLKTIKTVFGDEGVTLISDPAAQLHDRDRLVIELESAGYTLIGTFVLPEQRPLFDTSIGNIHLVRVEEASFATDAILRMLAHKQINAAKELYGDTNVVLCRTMRFPPQTDSAYEPHEFMALYARNASSEV
jgi:hypothetical protein